MRAGWVGNETLQNWLQRADPRASTIIEAHRVVAEDAILTKDDWDGTDSTTGVTTLEDGGAKITGTLSTVAEQATKTADVVTDLDNTEPFSVVELLFEAQHQGKELRQITCRLDPDQAGTGVDVERWRLQLFKVTRAEAGGQFYTLAPISDFVEVIHGGGTSASDVLFDLQSGSTPVTIPHGGDGNSEDYPETLPPSISRVYLFIWAIKGEGAGASNVAWLGDSGTNEASGTGWTARHRTFDLVNRDRYASQGGEFEDTGAGSGIPHFKMEVGSYTQQILTFTAAGNRLDLGSAVTEDPQVEARAQEFQGSAVTWELSVPGAATWVEVADGDIIGQDNTDTGGNDLSGLAVRQDYDVRVTLDPGLSGGSTPIARSIGIRDRESTDLTHLASIGDLRTAVDPSTLKSEIGSATLSIIKDGVTDYRDSYTELFADNHIGQIEFRAWIGSPDIARQKWLHMDDFLVEDHSSLKPSGRVDLVNALIFLRGLIPAYDSVADERTPVEYTDQLISAVYSDIINNQYLDGPPARRIGTGPPDPTIEQNEGGATISALVTKTIKEADGKDELDALAFLAGGSIISSQGRIKYVHVHHSLDDDASPHPVELIPMEEAAVEEVSPGFTERMDEFFVPWGWDDQRDGGSGGYVGEERDFSSAGLTKIGVTALRGGDPTRLEDTIAKWIPQSGTDAGGDPFSGLARTAAFRQVQALGVGMIIVPVRSTIARPHLEIGDVIAVETDRFVGRDPNSDRSIRGRMWLMGPVVWIDDPMGRNLGIWVRSYADILPTSANIQRQKYTVPKVTSVQPSFSTTGVLSASIMARVPDSGSVKVAASNSAYPTEATVDAQAAQALDAEGSAQVGSLGTFQAGDIAYVSVKAYENADGTGAESFEVFQVQVPRLPYVEPEITGDLTETETAGTGTFVVRDEALRVQAVEFQTKVGAGPWGGSWLSSWDSSTGAAGTDKGLERVESVTKDEKHVTGIKARMTYLDADGAAQEKFAVLAVDPERVAKIEDATVSFDESGNVDVQVEGDEDCAAIYVTVGDGSAPADPTAASNDGSVAASSGLIQTSVSVTDGAVAIVKVVGENSENSLGPVRTYRSTRGDPRPTGAVALDIDSAGAASAIGVGDSKVQSWKVAAAIGSAPSDATIRAATAIDQQSITQADVGTLVTATPGERVYLGAFAYDQTGGGGRESARLDDTELYGVTNDGVDDNAVGTQEIIDRAVESIKIGLEAVEQANVGIRAIGTNQLELAGVERENLALNIVNDDYVEVLQDPDTFANRVIAARHLFVGSFDNLIWNPGFEQGGVDPHEVVNLGGAGSGAFAVISNDTISRSGAYRLRFSTTTQTSEARVDLNGDFTDIDDHFAVAEGDQIYAEGYCRSESGIPANRVRLRIWWRDEGGAAIGSATGDYLEPPATYTKFSASGTAPAGVAYAHVSILIESDGEDNDLWFDDFYARRMVEGSIVVDGGIEAIHISISQVSELAEDLGIVIQGELRNAAGTRFMDLDATGSQPFILHDAFEIRADGDAFFSGTLNAANGTFTGSLTAVSGTFTGTLDAVDGTFTGSLSGVDGDFTGTLSAVGGSFSVITAGRLDNAASSPTAGIRLDSGSSIPAGWVRYIDLAATGNAAFLEHPAMTLEADGDATFGGTVTAESFTGTNPVFTGSVDVRGGESGNRVSIDATATGGRIILRDSSGFAGGTLESSASDHFEISAFTGWDLVIRADAGSGDNVELYAGNDVLIQPSGDADITPSGRIILTPGGGDIDIEADPASGFLVDFTQAVDTGSRSFTGEYVEVRAGGNVRYIPLHS